MSALLAAALCATASRAEMGTGTIDNSTREIYGGRVYTVQGNVSITGGQSESALTVKSGGGGDGTRIVIDIPVGCSLTVKGGDAGAVNGRLGAGAGIELPNNMTLYVTGKGKLTATGGNAADGGNGSGGGDAARDGKNYANGAGGNGGNGGGGAGAGIGGKGGQGASGGWGGGNETRRADQNAFPADGRSGGSNSDASNGWIGGAVILLGDVQVSATGGSAGAAGSASGHYGIVKWENYSNDHWFSGGGGPGGGGGGGGAADSIGGGGGGGGAGGGGGSGSFLKVDDWDDWSNLNLLDSAGNMDTGAITGAAGGNGGGAKNRDGTRSGGGTPTTGGKGRSHDNYEADRASSTAGSGANGGDGWTQGGRGPLYALPSVGLTVSPYRAPDAFNATAFANFLEVDVTLDLGLTDGSGRAVTATFKQPFAYGMKPLDDVEIGGVKPRATRAGYRFAGYWTDDGTCVYGPDYKPTMVMSPYTKDFTLHARWEVAPEILSVTSSGDGASTLGVYGNTAITLRDAVDALVADPLLVGTDGRRRVTFEKLPEGDTVIRLAGPIEVPAGVRTFEINGLYGLTNGVELVAGPNARHFDFQGKSSDTNGMFALSSLTLKGANHTWGGGSILLEKDAALSVEACSFLDNHAGINGGAIALTTTNCVLVASSTTFAGNSASGGGAVLVDDGYAFFANSTFSGNTANGSGGAIRVNPKGRIELLACTFAGNASASGDGPSVDCENTSAGAVKAVNCIFADPKTAKGDAVRTYSGKALSADWCSMNADPAAVFAGGGAAVTQVVAGVAHVVHPPLGGATGSGNEDAAEIYHDPSYKNVRAVGRDGREVVYAGNRDLATIPFILDQLSAVRTAPTRGAVRLAVGTEPVTVELDGVLCDEEGRPRPDTTVATPAVITYDSGEVAMTDLTIHTATGGVFGLSVPVDGSDGLAHNVTGIQIDALGPEPITVATAPYALTAASVDLIGANDYLPLYGDEIAIGNVAAGSISATNSFDARAAGTFTAGELKGFKQIDLEHVAVSGGALDWLGGAHPAAQSGPFANLSEMTIGGGVEAKVESTLPVSSGNTMRRRWQAASDGFFQLQARCQKPLEGEIQLKLLDKNGKDLVEVTSLGRASQKDEMRRLLWTVPVRAGDIVQLQFRPVDGVKVFELSSLKAQFIYFGVPE